MAQTKKAPVSARKPAVKSIRTAAVKMPAPKAGTGVSKPSPAIKPSFGRPRGPSIPVTNHIPIGIAAPSTAVEGTRIMVTVSFSAPVTQDQSVDVTGAWSGDPTIVAGPITIIVLAGSSNGSGQITAPSLRNAPNNQLILTAVFGSILLTASVTI